MILLYSERSEEASGFTLVFFFFYSVYKIHYRRGTLIRVTGLTIPQTPVMLGPPLMGFSRRANHPTVLKKPGY